MRIEASIFITHSGKLMLLKFIINGNGNYKALNIFAALILINFETFSTLSTRYFNLVCISVLDK